MIEIIKQSSPYLAFFSFLGTLLLGAMWLGKYKGKVDSLDSLNKDVAGHAIKLAVFDEFKNNATKILDKYLFESKSPLSLTEVGKKLLNDSGFMQAFDKVKDELIIIFFEEINPKTKYDTQERARQWMDELSRKDYQPFLPVKSYAFKTGSDYAQILRAGSILLRDYYLEKHPEIED